MRPGLALLSIVALFSLALEVELLQQIDALRRYLTGREIALEAGVALLFSLGMACAWWLFVWLVGQLARPAPLTQRTRVQLTWSLWIALPFAYLALDLFEDFKLEVLPRWHAGVNVQVLATLGLIVLGVAGLRRAGYPALLKFCSSRLAPIGWVHIILGIAAAVSLWAHGIRLFHDYERPVGEAVAASRSPDIYVITIDALRAEDTSVYGYGRATTLNLAKFAQRSFVFDYCFANSNFTTTATTTIETGKLPWSHRVFQGGGFLRDENQGQNIAAELRHRGYYTEMISSNLLATPVRHRTLESYDAVQYASPTGLTGLQFRETNLIGVNSQFTLWFSLLRGSTSLSQYLDRLLWQDRYPSPAEEVFGRAESLLERSNPSRPVFLWSHILPPHDPYWPPPKYRHRFEPEGTGSYKDFVTVYPGKQRSGVTVDQLHAAYDEMVLYADHAVGEYLDWLDRTGRLERSIVIVSADHGELFDHNRLSHGGPALYNSVIRIPLLIHLPGQQHGERISQLSQQADLLPTLLDLVGAPIPSWTDGISLKPALENGSLPDRYIFSMNFEPNRIFDPITKGTVAVMDGDFKLVRHLESGAEELYRYKTDAGEEHNLVETEPDVAGRLRSVLLGKLREVNQPLNGRQ